MFAHVLHVLSKKGTIDCAVSSRMKPLIRLTSSSSSMSARSEGTESVRGLLSPGDIGVEGTYGARALPIQQVLRCDLPRRR